MTPRCTCIGCQIGAPITCTETERRIRADERHRIRTLVTAGINNGDLDRLRRDLNNPTTRRAAQLLAHALLVVLDTEPIEGTAA